MTERWRRRLWTWHRWALAHRRFLLAVAVALALLGSAALTYSLASGQERAPSETGAYPDAPAADQLTPDPFAAAPIPEGAFPGPARPLRLRIPAIRVDAPFVELDLNGDGTLQVPPLADPNLVGWYRHGPTPGEVGPSVVVGHVDTRTKPAVFHRLRRMKAGHLVDVARGDGRVVTFTVEAVAEYLKSSFPTGKVYGEIDYPGLRLVTCGGPFDKRRGEYRDVIVVYARLTGIR